MKKSAIAFISGLLLSVVFVANVYSAEIPGSTQGSLQVGSSGQVSYSLPVIVPAGTNGMQPSLSIAYSSSRQNGPLGVGWSISGLQSIERCGKNLAQDGEVAGVEHTADDRFCLGGQKLVAVNGVYGADGTEYRTEVDGFIKVISNGAVANVNGGNAPASFTAWTKSGNILHFGTSADSRVNLPNNSSPHRWFLHKREDRSGNYFEVTYDAVDDTCLPVRIDYTINNAMALTADRFVEFVYESRTDNREFYVQGEKLESNARLQSLNSYVMVTGNDKLVRSYKPTYDYSTSTKRSRITQIEECAWDDVANAEICLTPHTFAWTGDYLPNAPFQFPVCDPYDANGDPVACPQGGGAPSQTLLDTPAFSTAIDPLGSLHNSEFATFSADFNRDGYTDVLSYKQSDGSNFLIINNGDATYTEITDPITPNDIDDGRGIFLGDWDADGDVDLLWYAAGNGRNHWFLNDGAFNFTLHESLIDRNTLGSDFNGGTGYETFKSGDWNGDGITDVMFFDGPTGETLWYINNGDLTFTEYVNPIPVADFISCPGADTYIGDWNADGLADVFCFDKGDGRNEWYINNGNMSFTHHSNAIVTNSIKKHETLSLVDWNADGLLDMFFRDKDDLDGSNKIFINKGNMTFNEISDQFDGVDDRYKRPLIGDFDGNGFPDLLAYRGGGNGGNRWYMNNGLGNFTLVQDAVATSDVKNIESTYAGDWNGDGAVDVLWRRSGSAHRLSFNQAVNADKIVSVTDTLGATTSVEYRPMTDTDVYTKDTGINAATFPEFDLISGQNLVSRVSSDNGIGGTNSTSYRYGGAKAHAQGRGGLGFRYMDVVNDQTDIASHTEYHQDFPYIGFSKSSETKLADSTVISASSSTYGSTTLNHPSGESTIFAYPDTSTSESFEIDGSPVKATFSDADYDSYGNVTNSIAHVGQTVGNWQLTTTTTNVLINDTVNWLLGLTDTITTSNSVFGSAPTQVNTSKLEYYADGKLHRTTVEPNGATNIRRVTEVTYDGYGNVLTSTASGADFTTRTSSSTYDANGLRAISSTNVYGHTETYQYNPICGRTSLTGPNALSSNWEYDAFCRQTKETRADGTETTVAYQFTTQPYTVTGQSTGTPVSIETYDILGRTIRTQSVGLLGQTILADTEYDSLGRAFRSSLPYFSGDTVYWVSSEYDIINRTTRQLYPDGTDVVNTYAGLTSTSTNVKNQTTTSVLDVRDLVVSVTDAANGTLTYAYDVHGNLTSTTDATSNVVQMSYDLLGRKLSMNDPDMGNWSYQYNSLGELVSQTDAKGQIMSMTYDNLGRLTSRTTVDGTSSWSYDTQTKGIGKLAQVTGANGYSYQPTYDALGRASSDTTTIDTVQYSSSVTYDSIGRVNTVSYPGTGLTVRNEYNTQGYLHKVVDDSSSTVYWQVNTTDAAGRTLTEQYGNGLSASNVYDQITGRLDAIQTGTNNSIQDLSYTYDGIGNMLSRADNNQTISESFQYDNLNRLTQYTTNGSIKTVQYDAIGNITYKSDVGTYNYIGGNNAGPHAISNIDTSNASPFLHPGGRNPDGTYTYDANGNMLTGGERVVTWNSFNKPSRVEENFVGYDLTYGPDFERIKKETDGGKLTVYIGKAYERITDGSTTKHRYYVGAGSATVQVTKESVNEEIRYLHTDHLGSTDVMTDETGAVVERLSFDPWGLRRESDWDDATAANPIVSDSTVGYTGHEQDDETGLINMNARIYDPLLGRFMSADSIIPSAHNMQAYNRYSYVMNNPTGNTDPSGHAPRPVDMDYIQSLMDWADGGHGFTSMRDQENWFYAIGAALLGFGPMDDIHPSVLETIVTATNDEDTMGIPYENRLEAAFYIDQGHQLRAARKNKKWYEKATEWMNRHSDGGNTIGVQVGTQEGQSGIYVSQSGRSPLFLPFSSPQQAANSLNNWGSSDDDWVGVDGLPDLPTPDAPAGFAEYLADGGGGSSTTSRQIEGSIDAAGGGFGSHVPGTATAINSTQYWVNIAVLSDHPLAPLAHVPGFLAVLWTPDVVLTTITSPIGGVAAFKGITFLASKTLGSSKIGHRFFTANRSNGSLNTGQFRFGWSGTNGSDIYSLMFRYNKRHSASIINVTRAKP